jgi:SagB-type dehydrogenase family enzyme
VKRSAHRPAKAALVRSTRRELKYRRVVPLVLYWQNNELIFLNYGLRSSFSADPTTCSILHFCGTWRTFLEIRSFLSSFRASSIRKNLEQLCESGALEKSRAKPDAQREAIASWASWNPAAGLFHFSTKDAKYTPDPVGAMKHLVEQVAHSRHEHMPEPLKPYPRAWRTKLPIVPGDGAFPEVLKKRRTWRIYGQSNVPLRAFAQSLQLTFGIQGWANVPGLGRAAIKTSPSCGCLHPIEAYVLVRRVEGLRKGFYHYNAVGHELEWLRAGIPEKVLERNLGNQWWFAKGAFLVLMTAVFARTHWKYDDPRVYRGILMEAGHLCQTFCLTATWLGLAPFCTIAYSDSQWEKWLRINGVTESILYIAGAGTQPNEAQVHSANLLTLE